MARITCKNCPYCYADKKGEYPYCHTFFDKEFAPCMKNYEWAKETKKPFEYIVKDENTIDSLVYSIRNKITKEIYVFQYECGFQVEAKYMSESLALNMLSILNANCDRYFISKMGCK